MLLFLNATMYSLQERGFLPNFAAESHNHKQAGFAVRQIQELEVQTHAERALEGYRVLAVGCRKLTQAILNTVHERLGIRGPLEPDMTAAQIHAKLDQIGFDQDHTERLILLNTSIVAFEQLVIDMMLEHECLANG